MLAGDATDLPGSTEGMWLATCPFGVSPLARGDTYLGPKRYVFDDGG